MRLIDGDALRDEFKARCICECDSCKYQKGAYCGLIDLAPTLDVSMEVNFTRAELESWLYQIAFNNCDNPLGDACEEIISRLDGFERFVVDKRKEDQTT